MPSKIKLKPLDAMTQSLTKIEEKIDKDISVNQNR